MDAPHCVRLGRRVRPSRARLSALALAFVVATPAAATLPRPWTQAGCESCHRPDPVLSHPVGVVPTLPIPDALPLDGGRITCTTCHDGRRAEDHAKARLNHTPLLRGSTPGGPAFCAQCHGGTVQRRQAMHGTVSTRAHLGWLAEPDGLDASAPFTPATVSPADRPADLTRECMSCHDGVLSADGGEAIPLAPLQSTGPGMAEHPVGMEYPAGIGAAGTRLNPLAMLDPRIRLPGGVVGCEACHSLYSRHDKLLVMPNLGSRLCLSCHDV